ncbi:MAG: hypothetical protein ACK4EY_03335 [Flavipsychrobacter sp.]
MELNIKQRFFVVSVYVAIIFGIGYFLSGDWNFVSDSSAYLNALLVVTGLALVFGTYITEPYFSKPIDVLTRWVAIYLFLLGLNDSSNLILYPIWKIGSIALIILSLFVIFLNGIKLWQKLQKIIVEIICTISRPEFVFSVLYFDIVFTFFKSQQVGFPLLVGFGILLIVNKPILWLAKWIWKLSSYIFSSNVSMQIGKVIGYESEDIYNVEIVEGGFTSATKKGKLLYLENNQVGIVGLVLSEKSLLNKKWIQVLSLRDSNKDLVCFDTSSFQLITNQKSIFSKDASVFSLDIAQLPNATQTIIQGNKPYNNFQNIIGYVTTGTTINQIKFTKLFDDNLLINRNIGEGTIVQTEIGNQEVLYQIIDARTAEESLEYKDSHGFTVGTAQKLGKYDFNAHELNTVKWLPDSYSPVFLLNPAQVPYSVTQFIGKLPNTHYGIPIKDPAALVTHNTAILGILGIGKSCLTFELIKKLIATTTVKIFCIDLTNQYVRELTRFCGTTIQDDISQNGKDTLIAGNRTGTPGDPNTWGNEALYRTTLDTELDTFIASANRVLVLNPDWHQVSKAGSNFNITHKVDLTAAEKTRHISERIFLKAKALGETVDPRYLIVFEEAHSLVPEWNSIANDGDKNATNGTAKVILQGRKYGLGSMVITQRTANISKSILNQCNTIFALRVFDDTGKQFLENYIGSDYSNLLPTLEERHCVAIGKAMRLKQPIILELNDTNEVIQNP